MSKWDWEFPDYGPNWAKVSEACKKRDKYTCRKCRAKGKQVGGSATLNACHIKSRRKGGRNVLANLLTMCEVCHSSQKGHSHMKSNPRIKKARKKKKKKFTF